MMEEQLRKQEELRLQEQREQQRRLQELMQLQVYYNHFFVASSHKKKNKWISSHGEIEISFDDFVFSQLQAEEEARKREQLKLQQQLEAQKQLAEQIRLQVTDSSFTI